MMKYLLTMKEMKKIFKNTSYLLIVLITFSACQSVKDGLSGKKKSNSDELSAITTKAEGEKCPVCWKINKSKCERHLV